MLPVNCLVLGICSTNINSRHNSPPTIEDFSKFGIDGSNDLQLSTQHYRIKPGWWRNDRNINLAKEADGLEQAAKDLERAALDLEHAHMDKMLLGKLSVGSNVGPVVDTITNKKRKARDLDIEPRRNNFSSSNHRNKVSDLNSNF